jgi:hypothetical protein
VTNDALSHERTTVSVALDALICALMAAAIVALSAIFVAATGLGDNARRALRFGFGGVDRSLAEVSWLALHNARYAGGTLLCALVAPRVPKRALLVTDLLLGSLLAFNAGLVGVAYGAYGWRAIAATAAHLPVEFAAISLTGGAYLHACRRPLSARALAAVAAASGVLLVGAALLETYVSMRGAR